MEDNQVKILLIDVETGDMAFRIDGKDMAVLAVNYEYGDADSIGGDKPVVLNRSELTVEYINPDENDDHIVKKTGFIKYVPNSIGGDSIE